MLGPPISSNTNSGERKFLCEYRYQGSLYAVELVANSQDEAEAMLKCISQGKVLGEIQAVIPYEFGWIAKGWVAAIDTWKTAVQALFPSS